MSDYKRIVVKIGTSTVCHENGAPNLRRIEEICRTLTDIKNSGCEIVLVTSGAIGVGTNKMQKKERPKSISGRQAAAAIGQCELMSIYDKYFLDYGTICGQILLTKDITENPQGEKNVISTFKALFKLHAIPIVNENDSVATEEIVYGDNDTLSAVVAKYVEADLLILLTDTEGLYDKDPNKNKNAKIIHVVKDIDKVKTYSNGSNSKHGTGGMVTKISAAEIAKEANIPTIIASGKNPKILYDILENKKVGTFFPVK